MTAHELRTVLRGELARRGMEEHVRALGDWPDAFVDDWLRVLQVHTDGKQVPIHPRGSHRCEAVDVHTARSLPDGAVMECLGCGRRWVELDGRSDAVVNVDAHRAIFVP